MCSVTFCGAAVLRVMDQRHSLINKNVHATNNVHATTPKGNMGYDQYTVPNDCSCRTYFCCFPLAIANICPWPLVPFFQISLENRADKTTHNTFGIVACSFSDKLSRNSCIIYKHSKSLPDTGLFARHKSLWGNKTQSTNM